MSIKALAVLRTPLRRLEDSLDPIINKRIAEYHKPVRNLEAEILVELYREIYS